jgi:hypothetical protein
VNFFIWGGGKPNHTPGHMSWLQTWLCPAPERRAKTTPNELAAMCSVPHVKHPFCDGGLTVDADGYNSLYVKTNDRIATWTAGGDDWFAVPKCKADEALSERFSVCVKKPSKDFVSCEVEKKRGGCPDGSDPNPWVTEHCARTCGVWGRPA